MVQRYILISKNKLYYNGDIALSSTKINLYFDLSILSIPLIVSSSTIVIQIITCILSLISDSIFINLHKSDITMLCCPGSSNINRPG